MPSRRPLSAILAVAALATLVGCSPTVNMTPAADDANNPACADVIVRLPDAMTDYDQNDVPKRETNAQSTAAWGEPTAMLLYCGVPAPGPSELPCIELNGIFWLREVVDAGLAFTAYGREPAVRVVIDEEALAPGVALRDLSTAVALLPGNGRECTDLDDTVSG